MATIRERKGKNYVSFQVRYIIDGVRYAKTFKSKSLKQKDINETLSLAKKFAQEIEAKKLLDIPVDETNITFKDYAETVFAVWDRNSAYQTKKNRRYALDKLYEYCGKWKLKDITPTKLENLFLKLAETNSDQVLRKYRDIFNIVFKSARKKRLITYNPVDALDIRISQKNLKEVTSIEIDILMDYLNHIRQRNKRIWVGLMLCFLTSLRIGEALALQLTDFEYFPNKIYFDESKTNYLAGIVRVTKNRQRNGEVGETKKGIKKIIPIYNKLDELYQFALQLRIEDMKKWGEDYQDNKLLVCKEDGTPYTYSAVRELMRRVERETSIKIRPHQLRHTFDTYMRGVELKDLQMITGNTKADTLLNVYIDHNGFRPETIQVLNERFNFVKLS